MDGLDDEPPRRMFTEGGVMIFPAHYRGVGHSGGGSTCSRYGYCNVPAGTTQPCKNYCKNLQCYDHYQSDGRVVTYQCHEGGARRSLTALSQLFCWGLTWLMVAHSSPI